MSKSVILGMLSFAAIILFAAAPPVRAGGIQRIPESIIVNGQPAHGVTVVENDAVQTYTCASPQPYTTADQSSSG